MVRTFCDRCGRVIAGASKLGGATVRAVDEHGNEIIKLDFCAFCADWAVNKLLRKALTERHEDEQAGERAMDKLEFDLTAGKLREKETSGEKEVPESERIGWTTKKARGTAAEEKKPVPNIKGRGAAEKKVIFDELLRYKERTGAGWAVRIGKATGGKVNSEVVRAIVTDGLVADMAVWRGIAKAIETLRKEEREAT